MRHFSRVLVVFGVWGQVQTDHLGDESPALPHLDGVGGDAYEGVGVRVEFLLEGDDHDVHGAFLALDVGGDLANVCVVQCGVNLVQDEERRRLVAGRSVSESFKPQN